MNLISVLNKYYNIRMVLSWLGSVLILRKQFFGAILDPLPYLRKQYLQYSPKEIYKLRQHPIKQFC